MKKFIVKDTFVIGETLFVKGDIAYADLLKRDHNISQWLVYHTHTRTKAGWLSCADAEKYLEETND